MWKLHKQVLELRFKNGYLYWDRTGEITLRHLAANSSYKVAKADPGQTVLVSDREGLHSMFSYEVASIIHEPEKASQTNFEERAEAFLGLTLKLTEVSELTRIGFRATYHRYLPTEKEADSVAHQLLAKTGVGGSLTRDWTDERVAKKAVVNAELRLEETHTGVRLEIGKGTLITDKSGVAKHVVVADADCYTRTPVSVELLHVAEFVRQNRKWIETQFLPRLP